MGVSLTSGSLYSTAGVGVVRSGFLSVPDEVSLLLACLFSAAGVTFAV